MNRVTGRSHTHPATKYRLPYSQESQSRVPRFLERMAGSYLNAIPLRVPGIEANASRNVSMGPSPHRRASQNKFSVRSFHIRRLFISQGYLE